MDNESFILYVQNLANESIKKNEFGYAIRFLQIALTKCTSNIQISNTKLILADTYRLIQEWENAIQYYKELEYYGTIGNIYLYLNELENAIKYYEINKDKKGYIYYNHPNVLFLSGKYLEALDLFSDIYKNRLPAEATLSKQNLNILMLCLNCAFNLSKLCENISDEKTVISSVPLKYVNMVSLILNQFQSFSLFKIHFEKILREEKKIIADIRKIYKRQVWGIEDLHLINFNYDEEVIQNLLNDEVEIKEFVNKNYFYGNLEYFGYSKVEILISEVFRNNKKLSGKDIFEHFKYFLPITKVFELFPDEFIKYYDEQIEKWEKKHQKSLNEYLYNKIKKFSIYKERNSNFLKNLFKDSDKVVRKRLNIPLKNEQWISETSIVKLLQKKFKPFEVIHQASPKWLYPLRYDAFIPELKLAVEYQGQQHFNAVEIFGGEEGLQQTKERDKRKLILSEVNGIKLEYINYNENILERIQDIFIKYYQEISK